MWNKNTHIVFCQSYDKFKQRSDFVECQKEGCEEAVKELLLSLGRYYKSDFSGEIIVSKIVMRQPFNTSRNKNGQ